MILVLREHKHFPSSFSVVKESHGKLSEKTNMPKSEEQERELKAAWPPKIPFCQIIHDPSFSSTSNTFAGVVHHQFCTYPIANWVRKSQVYL